MIVERDITKLVLILADPKATIFILAGSTDSKAGEVHNFISKQTWEPWFQWFLITDMSVLQSEEKKKWFDEKDIDRYAVVGGNQLPKKVAQKGPIDDLLNIDKSPGKLKIRKAFLAGDI